MLRSNSKYLHTLYPMKSEQLIGSPNDDRYLQKPYKNFGAVKMTATELNMPSKEAVAAVKSKFVNGKDTLEEEELQLISKAKVHTSVDAKLTQEPNLESRAIPETTQSVASTSESTKSNVNETYAEILKKNLVKLLKNMHNRWYNLGAFTKK